MAVFLKGYVATRAIKASGLDLLPGEACPDDACIPVGLFQALTRNKRLVLKGTSDEREATKRRLSQAPVSTAKASTSKSSGEKPKRRSRKDADAEVKDAGDGSE